MNKKEYQRQLSYRRGYTQGYYKRPLSLSALIRKGNDRDYMRGYAAGRKDYKDGEIAQYSRSN